MASYVPAPAAALTFVGSKVGAAAVKAVCTTAVAGRLTPEILGEALVSSSSVRSHVQAELLQFVAVRISLQSPRRLAWLVTLLSEFLAKGGGGSTDAVKLLSRKAVLYHVTSFGVRGTVASALAALAVQVGMSTCQLVSSNIWPLVTSPRGAQRRLAHGQAHRRRVRELQEASTKSSEGERAAIAQRVEAEEAAAQRQAWADETDGMSLAQYRYCLVTAALSGTGTVVGSGVGAAVGTCVLPGFGTVVGSILFSFSGGCLPSYLRDGKGPDDRRRAQVKELRKFSPLRMVEREADFVELLPVPPPSASGEEVNDLLVEDTMASEDSVVVLCRHHHADSSADNAEMGTETASATPAPRLSDSLPPAADAPAVKSSLFSLAQWTPAFPRASTTAPAGNRANDLASASALATAAEGTGSVATPEDTGDVSAASSMPRSGSEWSEMDHATELSHPAGDEMPPATASDLLTVLGGKMEVLPPGLDWAGVDRCIDAFGEEELVLVFRVDEPAKAHSET